MPESPAERKHDLNASQMSPAPITVGGRQLLVPTRKGFQIAQGEKGQSEPRTETHATTEAVGEEEPAGKIPDAMLLFWNSVLVALLLVAFALLARKSLQRVPKHFSFQNIGEMIVEGMNDFTTGIIGPEGVKYTPLVGTIFFYILAMNLIGLVPGLHSPTANLSITLALGVVVFVYVQYVGVKSNGVVGHVKHFAGPMPALAPLMFPVELISEFVKPFTLAIRLFGNIFGEDVIIVVLTGLALKLTGGYVFGWIPAQFPVLLLSLLTAMVQALVFSMLTCIYISLVSHHDDDHGHDHGQDHEESHGEGGAVEAGHHAHA